MQNKWILRFKILHCIGRSWVAPGENFLQQNEAGRVIKLTPHPPSPPTHCQKNSKKLQTKNVGGTVECVLAVGGGEERGSIKVFNKEQSQEKTTFCHEKSTIFGITCHHIVFSKSTSEQTRYNFTLQPPPPAANWAHFTPELYNTPSRMVFLTFWFFPLP